MSGSTNNAHQRGKRVAVSNTINKTLEADEEELQDLTTDNDDIDDDDEEVNEDGDQFSPHQRMPAQNPATRTCFQLLDLMSGERPYLDLNPHYQRNVVWTRKAKQMLIDSMFEGFFIPPVIFNVTKIIDEHGQQKFKRTCVDGKQRLSSIRDFMRGRFPWKLRSKEWYFTTPVNEDGSVMVNAKNKPILPEAQRQEFGNKYLVCVEYLDLTQTQEIELFQRVQLGKPLTKAETFKASQGAWQDLARAFEVDYAEVVNIPRQNNRASQFWSILSCFSQIYECMDPSAPDGIPRLKIRVPQIEKLCANEKSLDRKTKSHLRMVFDKFLELVQEDRSLFESSHYKTTKTFSPIELESICCLLSQWGEQRPIGMLQGDIRLLRDHLRLRHSELRSNDAQWATCWNYIDDLENFRGSVDEGIVTNARNVAPVQLTGPQQTPQFNTAKHGRKLTQGGDDEDDDDFRPSATTKRATDSSKRMKAGRPRASNNVSSHKNNQQLAALETEQQVSQRARMPRVRNSMASRSNNQDPSTVEAEQVGLSAAESSVSSAWDTDDALEKAARRAKAPVAPVGGSQGARKRALMDLGGNGNSGRDLEAKKARIMAARIKQEQGKGTPRRKQKKVHKTSGTDDKKLQTSLKKLNVQPIQAIEEVNMFKEDGNVIHFAAPKVHASVPSNTFAIYGNGEDKELTELVPGILNQLGPDSLASLRKLAESYQTMQKKDGGDSKEDDDDDIPDLVAGDNFESRVE